MGYIQVLFQSEKSSTFKIYTVGGSILVWLKERALLSSREFGSHFVNYFLLIFTKLLFLPENQFYFLKKRFNWYVPSILLIRVLPRHKNYFTS